MIKNLLRNVVHKEGKLCSKEICVCMRVGNMRKAALLWLSNLVATKCALLMCTFLGDPCDQNEPFSLCLWIISGSFNWGCACCDWERDDVSKDMLGRYVDRPSTPFQGKKTVLLFGAWYVIWCLKCKPSHLSQVVMHQHCKKISWSMCTSSK